MLHVDLDVLLNGLGGQAADQEPGAVTRRDGRSVLQGAETVRDAFVVVDESDDPEAEMRVAGDFFGESAAAFARAGDQDRYLPHVQPFQNLPHEAAHELGEHDVQGRADHDDHAREILHAAGEREVAEEQQIRREHGVDHAARLLHLVERHPRIEEIAVIQPDHGREQDEDEQERPHGDVRGHLVAAAHGVIDQGRAEPARREREDVGQDQEEDADAAGIHGSASSLR